MNYGSMGQAHRRPDQQSDPPPSAVAPTQSAGILRARTVIIFGTGKNIGLFVYNGTPAKGSLVAAIVPPGGAGTDPYGNTVSAVANFGTWSAAGVLLGHFGIDVFGNTYLANSSGLTVVQGASGDGSMRFYTTGGQALGNLAATIAPAAGTDAAGNAYQRGLTSYLPGTPATFAQLLNQSLRFATAQSVVLATMTGGASATESHISIGSGTGPEAGATASQLTVADSGNAFPGVTVNPPDGNTYDVARLTLFLSVSNVIINSAVTTTTIFSHAVGANTYEIEAWLVLVNTTPADGASIFFTGPGVGIGADLVDFQDTSGTSPAAVTYFASGTYTSAFSTQGVAGNQRLHILATVTFAAAGMLVLGGKELVAGNTVTVIEGSRMRICPIVAS